jgi:GNAT superfamily N-acetyltransferase
VTIRRAGPHEAEALSALALRSKALWDYDADFLEACRGPLTLSPEYVDECPVYVVEHAGRIAGFYGLRGESPVVRLEYLYVDPLAVGRGHGRALWDHALRSARAAGALEIVVEADPHAEPFYLRMGAERVGEAPSEAVADRMLPVLRLVL